MLKLTLKLTLIISLFAVTAFAEGEMTNGDRTDGSSGGGLACVECTSDKTDTKDTLDNSFVRFIQDYFYKIFG